MTPALRALIPLAITARALSLVPKLATREEVLEVMEAERKNQGRSAVAQALAVRLRTIRESKTTMGTTNTTNTQGACA